MIEMLVTGEVGSAITGVVLDGLAVERLAVAELSLFQNVNTPEDWAEYAAE